MSTSPERFMSALDAYIDACITARTPGSGVAGSQAAVQKTLARQTVINELRMLLQSDHHRPV